MPQGRREAIFLHARQFTPTTQMLLLAIPYRRAHGKVPFAINRLNVIAYDETQLPNAALLANFFRGVEKHPKASFWQAHYDDKS